MIVSNLRMRVRKVTRTAVTTTNGEEGRIAGAGKLMRREYRREKKSGKEGGDSPSYEISSRDGVDGATVYNHS